MGGDGNLVLRPALPSDFNPRPPCGGRRVHPQPPDVPVIISIHAPRVGGDGGTAPAVPQASISIHAPRVGGDVFMNSQAYDVDKFQSTPPVWGATNRSLQKGVADQISIHAPRVGGDDPGPGHPPGHGDFNPRPPCGGRHFSKSTLFPLFVFQSTPPVWGATSKKVFKIRLY